MNLTSTQTTIYLVRHGETDWNATGRLQGQEDVELNANGQQQALSLAKHFNTVWFDVIISSDLKRAYQTVITSYSIHYTKLYETTHKNVLVVHVRAKTWLNH